MGKMFQIFAAIVASLFLSDDVTDSSESAESSFDSTGGTQGSTVNPTGKPGIEELNSQDFKDIPPS